MSIWTIVEAVDFVRRIDKVARTVGFTVGLTGSVLFHGESAKDLDIVIYPMSTEVVCYGAIREALARKLGMQLVFEAVDVKAHWRMKGSLDNKAVEIWKDKEGRRVDVFFLS